MSHAREVVDLLKKDGRAWCDDCLSMQLAISPRQQVNSICNNLVRQEEFRRQRGVCAVCGRSKIVNITQTGSPKPRVAPERDPALDPIHEDITPQEFEERVRRYLTRTYETHFSKKTLNIGEGKVHEFDLVSDDDSIIVECKSYNWTKSGNYPSGKVATLKEAIFYFGLVSAACKILVMHRRPFPGKEPLVDAFYRRSRGLLGDVELWDYFAGIMPEEDCVRVIHPGQIDAQRRT